jgi:tRNA threonylcarbamoyladenosine biosynthesis protein TsaE
MEIIYRISAIKDAAREVWESAKVHNVWAFHGEMGAGKTTFIHALCELLEVTSVISSPTFAIINEYNSKTIGSIYHMDWYRLKDEEEAIQAGVEDCLLSGNFCLVEWPDKAPGILPDNTFHIHIKMQDDDTRQLFSE